MSVNTPSKLLFFPSGLIANEHAFTHITPVYAVIREISLVVRGGAEAPDAPSPAIRLEETIKISMEHNVHGLGEEAILCSSDPNAHTLLSSSGDLLTSQIYADAAAAQPSSEQFVAAVMQNVRALETHHSNWRAASTSNGGEALPANPLIEDATVGEKTPDDYQRAFQKRASKLAAQLRDAGILMRVSSAPLQNLMQLMRWLEEKEIAFDSSIIGDLMHPPFTRLPEPASMFSMEFDSDDSESDTAVSYTDDDSTSDFGDPSQVVA